MSDIQICLHAGQMLWGEPYFLLLFKIYILIILLKPLCSLYIIGQYCFQAILYVVFSLLPFFALPIQVSFLFQASAAQVLLENFFICSSSDSSHPFTMLSWISS